MDRYITYKKKAFLAFSLALAGIGFLSPAVFPKTEITLEATATSETSMTVDDSFSFIENIAPPITNQKIAEVEIGGNGKGGFEFQLSSQNDGKLVLQDPDKGSSIVNPTSGQQIEYSLNMSAYTPDTSSATSTPIPVQVSPEPTPAPVQASQAPAAPLQTTSEQNETKKTNPKEPDQPAKTPTAQNSKGTPPNTTKPGGEDKDQPEKKTQPSAEILNKMKDVLNNVVQKLFVSGDSASKGLKLDLAVSTLGDDALSNGTYRDVITVSIVDL